MHRGMDTGSDEHLDPCEQNFIYVNLWKDKDNNNNQKKEKRKARLSPLLLRWRRVNVNVLRVVGEKQLSPCFGVGWGD